MDYGIVRTRLRSLWFLQERLPVWSWGLLRPRPALFVAWGAISVFGAISQPFAQKTDMPFGLLLVYWFASTLMRACCECLVRSHLRREFDLPVAFSVIVEPVFVAMLLAPMLIVVGLLTQTMEPMTMLLMLVRAYLLSLFISACEVMIRSAFPRDTNPRQPPRRIVVDYYNERRIRDHF